MKQYTFTYKAINKEDTNLWAENVFTLMESENITFDKLMNIAREAAINSFEYDNKEDAKEWNIIIVFKAN